jgi:hypothetical protein
VEGVLESVRGVALEGAWRGQKWYDVILAEPIDSRRCSPGGRGGEGPESNGWVNGVQMGGGWGCKWQERARILR